MAADRFEPGVVRALEGRVAIVTGAASGLGAAIAMRLAQDGAAVVVADRDVEGGQGVASSITSAPAVFQQADVTRAEDWAALVERTLARFGRVDVLVNNAGAGLPTGPMLEVDQAALDRLYRVNVKSIYHSAQHVVPVMRSQGAGSIVQVASIAGLRPRAGQVCYSGLKGIVVGFTRSMAIELGPDHIRVNAICPVVTPTPLVRRNLSPEREARLIAEIPLGRLGQPRDTAHVAAYLASDQATFITGTCIEVDGGRAI